MVVRRGVAWAIPYFPAASSSKRVAAQGKGGGEMTKRDRQAEEYRHELRTPPRLRHDPHLFCRARERDVVEAIGRLNNALEMCAGGGPLPQHARDTAVALRDERIDGLLAENKALTAEVTSLRERHARAVTLFEAAIDTCCTLEEKVLRLQRAVAELHRLRSPDDTTTNNG